MSFSSIRRLGAVLALLTVPVLASQAATAQRGGMNVPEHANRPVVMELFSSQSCGNCPVANRNIAKLAERTDVIAVTYPVGYWDYLGWDDTFAKPEFAERQTRYNRILGHRGPYTPQVIYSGRLHGSGVDMKQIEDKFAIRDISPYPASVGFDGDTLTLDGKIPVNVKDKGGQSKAGVVLIHFRPGSTTVTPGAGVNQGKSMTYFNLVTGYEMLGQWTGGPARFPVKCTSGCLVLVQNGGPEGTIIGVAQR